MKVPDSVGLWWRPGDSEVVGLFELGSRDGDGEFDIVSMNCVSGVKMEEQNKEMCRLDEFLVHTLNTVSASLSASSSTGIGRITYYKKNCMGKIRSPSNKKT